MMDVSRKISLVSIVVLLNISRDDEAVNTFCGCSKDVFHSCRIFASVLK